MELESNDNKTWEPNSKLCANTPNPINLKWKYIEPRKLNAWEWFIEVSHCEESKQDNKDEEFRGINSKGQISKIAHF